MAIDDVGIKSALYLVRHTAVAVPGGTCYGRSDVALQAPVDRHAAWLRTMLPADVPVFCSPLSRCLVLAEALCPAPGAPIVDGRLVEMDFGDWEMRRFDDIVREQIEAWSRDPFGFRPPGGECGREVMVRVQAALAGIMAKHASAVIVSHGGPLRGIHGTLLGLPMQHWLACKIEPGSLVVLRQGADQWHAEYIQCPESAKS
ncbi:MAG: putative alpha-ribazole phosphatase [Rhodocyclales bacterium]|nr:putative alpha-ribazole phosphatase [Rhodocyclales bacterium]